MKQNKQNKKRSRVEEQAGSEDWQDRTEGTTAGRTAAVCCVYYGSCLGVALFLRPGH